MLRRVTFDAPRTPNPAVVHAAPTRTPVRLVRLRAHAAAAPLAAAFVVLLVAEGAAQEPRRDVDAGDYARPAALLRLRSGTFDPLNDRRPDAPQLFEPNPEGRLHLVQARKGALVAVDAALRAAGATVGDYVPDDASLAAFDAALVPTLRALSGVRAIAPLRPIDRLPAEDAAALSASSDDARAEWTCVLAFDGSAARKRRLLERLAPLGAAAPIEPEDGSRVFPFDLSRRAALAALASDDVLWLERRGAARGDMDVVRAAFGVDVVARKPTPGFFGAGVSGEILDFGALPTHVDLRGAVVRTASSVATRHGTAAASIAFGKGLADPRARGMLPEGRAILADARALDATYDRFAVAAALIKPPYEAIFQSCGFGSPWSKSYGAPSFAIDELAFAFDLSIFQSVGNRAGRDLRPEAWAKNAISVGAVLHRGTEERSDDAWQNASGFGPSADGRRKPDVVGFGDAIHAASNEADDAYFPHFSGTSAATPEVAGAAGLLAEMFARGVFGERPAGATVFERRPRPATLKALLLASARPYPFDDPNADLARVRQGYGTPDVGAAYAFGESRRASVVDERIALLQGASFERVVDVAPSTPDLRVALAYADPPAPPFVSTQRINDLDLRVEGPDGSVYRGGVGLDVGPYSREGGKADRADTVECVFVERPNAGLWRVRVEATILVRDGRPETRALDVDFGLAIFGGAPIDGGAPHPEAAGDALWLTTEKALSASGCGPGVGARGPFRATFDARSSAARFRLGGAGLARRIVVAIPDVATSGPPRRTNDGLDDAFRLVEDLALLADRRDRGDAAFGVDVPLDGLSLPIGARIVVVGLAVVETPKVVVVASPRFECAFE
jgi:serine protease AprX